MCDAAVLQARHARARAQLDGLGLERLLITTLPNVAWLTGFFGSAAAAVIEPDAIVLVTDRRYAADAEALLGPGSGLMLELVAQSYDETLASIISRRDRPIGFEAPSLTVERHRWLTAALAAASWPATRSLVPTAGVIEACRIVKDRWEAAQLREGGRRLSAVAHGLLADLGPGVRESEVASAIEAGLRRAGFSRPAFDTIVASGPRSALPHGRASDRTLVAGDLVVLDFGGVYGGYCVDLTRTIALGDPPKDAPRVYAAVAEAQVAAFGAATPGALVAAIDAAAREVLVRHGLGEWFSHGTGHGLGLEVHEAPRLSPQRPESSRPPLSGTVVLPETVLPGMAFTIEPGVYLPGWGGVRIEDDVLVTADGAEWLTSVPKTLTLAP